MVNRSSAARSSASCPRAQPRQRQRRVSPPGQHHAQLRRPVLQQEPQRRMHRLETDQVIVIQHQRPLAGTGPGGQLVDQRRYQPLERHPGQAGRSAGSPARRSPGTHGPARLAHGARGGPGRCHRHPATARRRDRPGRAQSASRTVLPDPAGAHTRIRPCPSPSSSRCARRGRDTKPGRGPGTCSLAASSTSRSAAAVPDLAAPGGSVNGDLHAHRLQPSIVRRYVQGRRPIPGAARNRRALPQERPEGFGVPEAPPRSGAGHRCPARGRPGQRHLRAQCGHRRFHPQDTFR